MPCLLGCFALAFPRLALIVMWFIGYGSRAFDTMLWPLLGFLFMPYTTCMYAIAQNDFGGVDNGVGLVLLIVGVVLDLGSHGGGAHYGTRRRTVIVRRDA
jgi:hypothetical protein